jgi:hypothetical protein
VFLTGKQIIVTIKFGIVSFMPIFFPLNLSSQQTQGDPEPSTRPLPCPGIGLLQLLQIWIRSSSPQTDKVGIQ